MKWSAEADEAVKKIPFFVRKRVRARIEKEAGEAGKTSVSLADVKATQARYLSSMASEIKGYRVETCFGPGGCPNRANIGEDLLEKVQGVLKQAGLLDLLKKTVKGELKFHHEFRVAMADCPNACSQPQIADVGIIGATRPGVTSAACSLCGCCVNACRESAVLLPEGSRSPEIDKGGCLYCGRCIDACPTGSLGPDKKGYRVMLAGKLGRHPGLARELPGIYTETQVLEILKICLALYKARSRQGERFSSLFEDADFEAVIERISPFPDGR